MTRDPQERIDELLAANTRLTEEARDSRARALKLEAAMSRMIGDIGTSELRRIESDKPATFYGYPVSRALVDVLTERRSQLNAHGYSAGHDDKHDKGELFLAAFTTLARVTTATGNPLASAALRDVIEHLAPWRQRARPRRHAMIVAMAFLMAEVERLDRTGYSEPKGEGPLHMTNTPRAGRCTRLMRLNVAVAVPRSCPECGLGPCKFPDSQGK